MRTLLSIMATNNDTAITVAEALATQFNIATDENSKIVKFEHVDTVDVLTAIEEHLKVNSIPANIKAQRITEPYTIDLTLN